MTACFWMKAADVNEGTPLSYAVSGEANEFIIYNYKSFMLFVGGEHRSVKMTVMKVVFTLKQPDISIPLTRILYRTNSNQKLTNAIERHRTLGVLLH